MERQIILKRGMVGDSGASFVARGIISYVVGCM